MFIPSRVPRFIAGLGSLFALVSLGMILGAAGCASAPAVKTTGRILIVDEAGAPVQGALVLPEDEEGRGARHVVWTRNEIADRVSDSQGLVQADLDQYYWESDDCYHLRVATTGFEDVAMTVSKDLFPAVLKISLEATQKGSRRLP